MDQRLNDGAQKFLGDYVYDLRTNLIQDSLYNSLHKRGVRHHRR